MLSQLSESVSFPRPVPMGAVICLPHAQPRMKGDFCKVHFVSDSAEAEVVLLGFLSIPFTNFAVYQFLARGVHPSYQGSRLSLVPGTNTGVDISDDTCEPGLASAARNCLLKTQPSVPFLSVILTTHTKKRVSF